MRARTLLRIATFLAVASVCGLAWIQTNASANQASSHPNLAYAKNMTFGIDPRWSGDLHVDNFYDLNNFICTDGIAIQLASQTAGDGGGHSLALTKVQDYTGVAPIKDSSTGADLGLDPNAPPVSMAGSLPDTFASSADGTLFSTTDYVFPYQSGTTEPLGEEVVATINRLDHGDSSHQNGVLNEEPISGTAEGDPGSNGDDAIVPVAGTPSYIPTDPSRYQGWGSTDDGSAAGAASEVALHEGVNFGDGSSFDDVARTDQVPSGTSSDMFLSVPDPANSKVQDCVVKKQAPQTSISFSPSSPASSGWYNSSTGTPTITLSRHLGYYNGAPYSTSYSLDSGTSQSSSDMSVTVAPQPGEGTHTLQYNSADSAGDTEATQTANFKIDTVAPTVTCNAATFILGQSSSQVTASVADSTSGPQNASVSAAADTSTAGAHSASLTGYDNAGNSTTVSCPYSVEYGTSLLYRAPMSAKSGSTIPIKLKLTNSDGTNVSSASTSIQALCVVPSGNTDCTGAAITYSNQFFTYLASLAPGGGYQYNVKSTGLSINKTYKLLFRVQGEASSSYHPAAGATFTLTK